MCDETDSKSNNSINSILYYSHVGRKYYFVVFSASQFPYVNSVSQFNDGSD